MQSIRIGSVFGIPVQLSLSFLLVLPLITYLIGIQVSELVLLLNRTWHVGISASTLSAGWSPWILGIISAIGLFISVLLHEFGHALVGRRFGYITESITLWFLGGVSSFSEIPKDWRQEFLIAIAGPAVSIVLGGICYGVLVLLPSAFDAARFIVGYLGLLNFTLAIFNLLPGFPMDGGRVLRALLARNHSHTRATQIAASVGKALAVVFGFLGILSFNIFLIAIAFFVYISATGEVMQETLSAAFEGMTAQDLMTPLSDLDTVDPEMSVSELLEEMLRQKHVGYPVTEDGAVIGIVTLDDSNQVAPMERDYHTVRSIMSTDLKTVLADDDAKDVLTEFQRHGVGRILVVDELGDVIGLITRTDIMTVLRVSQQGA